MMGVLVFCDMHVPFFSFSSLSPSSLPLYLVGTSCGYRSTGLRIATFLQEFAGNSGLVRPNPILNKVWNDPKPK